MPTKISVLIPFKNTAAYLPECIDSILNQTFSDWEAIFVDDHSSDNSAKIVQNYAKNDSRIKCLKNKGSGIITALCTAYGDCNGNLITRMDSDDIMMPEKLQAMQLDLYTKGKGHIALGLVEYFSEKGVNDGYKRYEKWLNKLISAGCNFDEIYKECVIPSPCWMVHREDFDKCGGFQSNIYPEDYDLAFRFFKFGLKCIPSKNILHRWRDYAVRTSRTSPNYAENSFVDLKLKYFLELSYDHSKTLVLWGAGKKGKKLAALLLKIKIPFEWICDNPKKIGKNIYGKILKPWSTLSKINKSQSIITVANENAQEFMVNYFNQQNKKHMKDYFFFT